MNGVVVGQPQADGEDNHVPHVHVVPAVAHVAHGDRQRSQVRQRGNQSRPQRPELQRDQAENHQRCRQQREEQVANQRRQRQGRDIRLSRQPGLNSRPLGKLLPQRAFQLANQFQRLLRTNLGNPQPDPRPRSIGRQIVVMMGRLGEFLGEPGGPFQPPLTGRSLGNQFQVALRDPASGPVRHHLAEQVGVRLSRQHAGQAAGLAGELDRLVKDLGLEEPPGPVGLQADLQRHHAREFLLDQLQGLDGGMIGLKGLERVVAVDADCPGPPQRDRHHQQCPADRWPGMSGHRRPQGGRHAGDRSRASLECRIAPGRGEEPEQRPQRQQRAEILEPHPQRRLPGKPLQHQRPGGRHAGEPNRRRHRGQQAGGGHVGNRPLRRRQPVSTARLHLLGITAHQLHRTRDANNQQQHRQHIADEVERFPRRREHRERPGQRDPHSDHGEQRARDRAEHEPQHRQVGDRRQRDQRPLVGPQVVHNLNPQDWQPGQPPPVSGRQGLAVQDPLDLPYEGLGLVNVGLVEVEKDGQRGQPIVAAQQPATQQGHVVELPAGAKRGVLVERVGLHNPLQPHSPQPGPRSLQRRQ